MFEERPGSDRCAETSVAVEFGCMSASTIRDEADEHVFLDVRRVLRRTRPFFDEQRLKMENSIRDLRLTPSEFNVVQSQLQDSVLLSCC